MPADEAAARVEVGPLNVEGTDAAAVDQPGGRAQVGVVGERPQSPQRVAEAGRVVEPAGFDDVQHQQRGSHLQELRVLRHV